MTGWASETGVFDKRVKVATMTVDQLNGVAMGLDAPVVGGLKKSPWTEMDRDALAETAAELYQGWLSECPEIESTRNRSFSVKSCRPSGKSSLRSGLGCICGGTPCIFLPRALEAGPQLGAQCACTRECLSAFRTSTKFCIVVDP